MTKQAKPKCGVGQSCGYSCISIKDTCRDKVDPGASAGLINLVQNAAVYKAKALNSFPASDEGKTFDELAAKYPYKAGAGTSEKIGDLTVWAVSMEASDGSGDSLAYAFAIKGSKQYTISDGNVKEVTASDKDALAKEGLAAALRAKAVDIDNEPQANANSILPKASAPESIGIASAGLGEASRQPTIEPYSAKKTLGAGFFGEAVLTDRGTVVKTISDSFDASRKDKLLADEVAGLLKMGELGVSPKLLAVDYDKHSLEMELAQGKTMRQLTKKDDKLKATKGAVQAVIKLHRAGFTHQDLHDGNVMMDSTGKVQLIDAGLSGYVGKPHGGTANIAKSGLYDIQNFLPKDNSIRTDVEARLRSAGALKQYAEDYKAVLDLPLEATRAEADALRSKAELKLHSAYLAALDELGL